MNYIIITENEIQLHLKKYFHRLTTNEIISLQRTLDHALVELYHLQQKGVVNGKRND